MYGAEKAGNVSGNCICPYLVPLQVRDLNTKIEELEAVGGRKLKTQVAALESKMLGLEDQLDAASKLVTSEGQVQSQLPP